MVSEKILFVGTGLPILKFMQNLQPMQVAPPWGQNLEPIQVTPPWNWFLSEKWFKLYGSGNVFCMPTVFSYLWSSSDDLEEGSVLSRAFERLRDCQNCALHATKAIRYLPLTASMRAFWILMDIILKSINPSPPNGRKPVFRNLQEPFTGFYFLCNSGVKASLVCCGVVWCATSPLRCCVHTAWQAFPGGVLVVSHSRMMSPW